jgi:hypothetical protein
MNGTYASEVSTYSGIQYIIACWCCTHFPLVFFYAFIVVPQIDIDILIVASYYHSTSSWTNFIVSCSTFVILGKRRLASALTLLARYPSSSFALSITCQVRCLIHESLTSSQSIHRPARINFVQCALLRHSLLDAQLRTIIYLHLFLLFYRSFALLYPSLSCPPFLLSPADHPERCVA